MPSGKKIKELRLKAGLTQKELAQELRDNGFKVIKIFKGDIDFDTFEKWEFLNRKQ